MKTRALLISLLGIALASCAQPSVGTVLVTGVCGPTAACKFSGKCDAYIVVNPTLDTSLTKYLELFFEFQNQLADNSDKSTGRLNTNDAFITSGTVEFAGSLTGKVPLTVNGIVPTAGASVMGAVIIPPEAGALLRDPPLAYPALDQLTAKVRFRGHYADGSTFETSDFTVNIEVTAGAPQTATCADACPQVGQYPAGCGT
jgi:hypothetical protein